MRRTADRLNILFLIIGIIGTLAYPYLREYSLKAFMPRYLIFHWYILFPILSFSIGYLLFRVVLIKATVQIPIGWKRILMCLLHLIIGTYLLVSIITCLHCYVNFLPSIIADKLLYWMAMIYEHGLLAFAIIGGLYSVAVA